MEASLVPAASLRLVMEASLVPAASLRRVEGLASLVPAASLRRVEGLASSWFQRPLCAVWKVWPRPQ